MTTEMTVWTDGSCRNVPDTAQPTGMGVIWEVGEFVVRMGMHGKPGTNNTAELTAILAAMWWISPEARKHIHLIVYSDSEYSIGVLTQPWKLKKNVELITKIKNHILEFEAVTFKHVKGHEGVWGNEEADRLAGEGRLLPDQEKPYVSHISVLRNTGDGNLEELLTSEQPKEVWICQPEGLQISLRPGLWPSK